MCSACGNPSKINGRVQPANNEIVLCAGNKQINGPQRLSRMLPGTEGTAWRLVTGEQLRLALPSLSQALRACISSSPFSVKIASSAPEHEAKNLLISRGKRTVLHAQSHPCGESQKRTRLHRARPSGWVEPFCLQAQLLPSHSGLLHMTQYCRHTQGQEPGRH